MKKYHVATGDGKAYYGVNYESYREAEAVLKFSKKRDPQAHIVEEEYHFSNADRIRAMSDEQLAKLFMDFAVNCYDDCGVSAEIITTDYVMEWLKQPAEE